jgi:hypothetical protein
MSDVTSHRSLDQRIEELVREHIAAVQRSAREAVDRAFAGSGGVAAAVRRSAKSRAAQGGKRRAPTEMSAVVERLYRAVCARPGEGMAALADELGARPQELHRPMALLRQAGRVRSVGQRHQTRYFPRAGASS